MRPIFLIARYEFLKFITRRATFIGLLLFPVAFGLTVGTSYLTARNAPVAPFTVIDRAHGGYYDVVAAAIDRDEKNQIRLSLAGYAKLYTDYAALERRAPQMTKMLEAGDGDRPALATFEKMGGRDAVLTAMNPFLKSSAPGYEAPPSRLELIPPPQSLLSADKMQFGTRVKPYLTGREQMDQRLRYVVVVPENFGVGPGHEGTVEIWRDNPASANFRNFIRGIFSDELTLQALKPSPTERNAILIDLGRIASVNEASLNDSASVKQARADQMKVYVPMALAYLLMITVLSNAGLLLGSVIEEKSSRVVEVMLSCVSPRTFMAGKLLGAVICALTMIIMLLIVIVPGVAFFAPGGLSFLSELTDMPLWQMAAMVVYFVSALMIYASIYLAIGSMAASTQDAQALIGPMMIVMMLPFFFIGALISAPNGPLATAVSWVPPFTSFFMMFRLPWHPPVFEVWGTTVLIIVTAVFVVRQMGRVFAANLLTTEKPPALGALLAKLLRRDRVA